MISFRLARRLRNEGLRWQPQLHDFFHIPDRGFDDRVFVIADMSIDVQTLGDHATITFNGVVEWSLDYILRQDVVWVPTEEQLRRLIGDRLLALDRDDGRWRCRIEIGEETLSFAAEKPADAYGRAVLELLERGVRPVLAD